MKITLHRDWEVIDASKAPIVIKAIIPAGTHEFEQIDDPYGYHDKWLVLKGKRIGARRRMWESWSERMRDSEYSEFKVDIQE